tara:strand:+ start:347 stop:1564 length:1218 start_codon:yes stop_codon:yes gene_type:complete
MPYSKIIITNSITPTAKPNAFDLSIGELTINVADGKIFALNASNEVVKIADHSYESRISTLEINPGIWGSIAGTLSNQTDLTEALDTKLNTADLTNAVFNTSSVAEGATITLSPSYGTDTTFDIVGSGAGLSVTTANDIVTLSHTDTIRADTTGTVSGVFGDTVDVITNVSSNGKGHLTGVETSTLTLPNVQSLEDRLDALEYVPIDITSFLAPVNSIYEYGSGPGSFTLDWSTNTTPSSLILISPISGGVPVSTGDTSYTEPTFTVNSTLGAETVNTWELYAYDAQNNEASESFTLTWVYPFFFGEDSADLSSGTGIEGLTSSISRKSNKTIAVSGTNEFIYFAYPQTYGLLNSILDGNGFNVTSSFTQYGASVYQAVSGDSISYNIYKSNSVTTINQNFQYKF